MKTESSHAFAPGPLTMNWPMWRDVEHARRRADGAVFGEDAAGVLHGHRPAAEADHLAPEPDVRGVQRRLLERGRGGCSAVAGGIEAASVDTAMHRREPPALSKPDATQARTGNGDPRGRSGAR